MSPKEEWQKGVETAERAANGRFDMLSMLLRSMYIDAVIAKSAPPKLEAGFNRCECGLIGSDGEYVYVDADYSVRWHSGEDIPIIDVQHAWASQSDVLTILSDGQIKKIESDCLENYRKRLSNHVSTARFVESRRAA